jgi:hypothetical protein
MAASSLVRRGKAPLLPLDLEVGGWEQGHPLEIVGMKGQDG